VFAADLVPSSLFFFGGLSIHLSKALLAYLFSYNIQWGATKKEVERSNFFIEVPRILKRFRVAFVVALLALIAIVVLCLPVVPVGWRFHIVSDWALIFPLALTCILHLLFPVSRLGSSFVTACLRLAADCPQPMVDDLLVLEVLFLHLGLMTSDWTHRRCTPVCMPPRVSP
jgi:hypothetical protein